MMKITKEQLKRIIAEELSEMERVPVPRDDPFGRDQTKEIKSHLRALKKIFDEVGLKNVPDEMKRGLSKIRTALDDIPGLKEELERFEEGKKLYGYSSIYLSTKSEESDDETLSDYKLFNIEVDHGDSPYIHYYVVRDGQKIYLPINSKGELAVPDAIYGYTPKIMYGSSLPNGEGDKIYLGRAGASVGNLFKRKA